MILVGEPPYLECSSAGDARFSAFYAKIRGRGNKSIEELYQSNKVFFDGSRPKDWRKAKGKRAANYAELRIFYSVLWYEYLNERPHLWRILMQQSGLSDMFGQDNHVCQATALWELRASHIHILTADLL